MPRRSERGEGNLGCILWLLALGLALLIAWKAVPVKIQSTELYDYMDELAKFSAANTSADDLKTRLIIRAGELRIPLRKEDITIERNRDRVYMEVAYTIPVEFPGYIYQWHFRQRLDRPIFVV
jgi:hypothetical protein